MLFVDNEKNIFILYTLFFIETSICRRLRVLLPDIRPDGICVCARYLHGQVERGIHGIPGEYFPNFVIIEIL